MAKISILDGIESGEPARVIPVTSSRSHHLSSSRKRRRRYPGPRFAPPYPRHQTGYAIQAALMVEEEVGAPTGKQSRLTAMTEVCFRKPKHTRATLARQLRDKKVQNLPITCHCPRRIEPTTLNIGDAIKHPDDPIPEGFSDLPAKLEVKRVVDLVGRFRGAKTMVEDTETAFVEFYRQVRQNLTPWRALPPPKYKNHGGSERARINN